MLHGRANLCRITQVVRLSNCLYNLTLIGLHSETKQNYMLDKLHAFDSYTASLSYLNRLVIDGYAVADSPSVSHVQQKILRHKEQKRQAS